MAIEKSNFKVSRMDLEFSPRSRESMSSDEDEPQQRNSALESDDDNEFDDADSGAGSDDFDLLELGETGAEFCQVGNQTCSILLELYNLPGLEDILSVDVWNDCLSEEERFELAKYLPDMDQETFVQTLKELFTGSNFHFGSPIKKLFDMLKGGLCEPRVALYREGLNFFQKRQHYHLLRKHHNSMVSNLCQIRDAWFKYRGYSIEERLRVLNIVRSQKSLMNEKMDDLEVDSSDDGSGDGIWSRKSKARKIMPKMGRHTSHGAVSGLESYPWGCSMVMEPEKHGKKNPKGILKLAGSKTPSAKDPADQLHTVYHGLDMHSGLNGSAAALPRRNKLLGHDTGSILKVRGQVRNGDIYGKMTYGSAEKSHVMRVGKKNNLLRGDETITDSLMGLPLSSKPDLHVYALNANQSSDMKRFTAKPSSTRTSYAFPRKAKFRENVQEYVVGDRVKLKGRGSQLPLKGNIVDSSDHGELFYSNKTPGEEFNMGSSFKYDDWNLRRKNSKPGHESPDLSYAAYRSSSPQVSDRILSPDFGTKSLREKIRGPFIQNGGQDTVAVRGNDYVGEEEEESPETRLLVDDNGVRQSRLGRKGQKYDVSKGDQHEAALLGYNRVTKKRKVKNAMTDLDVRDEDAVPLSNFLSRVDDSNSMKRKLKKKVEAATGSSDMDYSEPPIADMGTVDMELETKPQKKPFTLITPTVHTGFSFSIVHLLSAVRMAMITPLPEDSLEVGKHREEQNKAQDGCVNGILSNEKEAGNREHAGQLNNMPSLTIQEIVNRVRSNPGDPCILETQEPLQDLVRGVLKIFSSKTAPLGAKGWTVLAVYEKSTRSWSWFGPVSHNSSDHDTIEEVTSPDAWGIPHKMLVKLVDSFANWLKCGQETLQQIGSLPAPPLALMQVNLDEKERFRDLRAQKSLNTISPSSEEVRSYFRKEEVLRYSIPDRAFSYTAADGKKSIGAPLRRCGGKPTSKAREHFMLKHDRPPHVTILCLVRDAAARLPGSIGTRADVCTLIRDSQYIVEDVSDAQVNQVVSGALDRLHYERDPCVQFDGERKLWVYLHREREEEDFEDDGTSSTKKWKRQKKDAADQTDQGAVTVAYHGTREQSGYDLCSDLNAEPPCIDDDKGTELVSKDARLNAQDNIDVDHASEQGNVSQDNSMVWETLGLDSARENKLLCQEDPTNEDFDDESFGRERPSGIISASLL